MLTPLEKELLTYVEELTTACEASMKQLRASEAALMSLEDRLIKQTKLMSRDLIYTVIALADSQVALISSSGECGSCGEQASNMSLDQAEQLKLLENANDNLKKVFKWMLD